MIGMAYIGKSNQKAISRLLAFASGDVSDEVRKAAAINLGFVLLNNINEVAK